MYKELNIDKDLNNFLNYLNKFNKTYIVGGYVRDLFLGMESYDVDIATAIPLNDLVNIFKKNNIVYKIVSEKFEIVRIKLKDKKIEIARMRHELKYNSNRKDVDFEFTNNVAYDILRRDFTINTICSYNNEFHSYIDTAFYDLENRILCSVADPYKKFWEDPYRILRGLRFFSEKNLKFIEEETIIAMKERGILIWTLPVEMIKKELIKIIKGDNYINTIKVINNINIFDFKLNHTTYKEDYIDRLKDIFDEKNIEILKWLNFSNKIIKLINRGIK